MDERKQLPSSTFSHQRFAATITKGCTDYLVARTSGTKTLLSNSESGVSIEVADGVKSVIMQHVHTDFDSIRKYTSKEECLISPVVYLHAQEVTDEKESAEYRYKAMIPHYLPVGHNLSSVKVRCGNIKRGFLREIRRRGPESTTVLSYVVDIHHVTLYSNHFCDVMCTSTDKVCTSKVMAFPFGWIGQQKFGANVITRMKLKTYLCSYLFADNGLQSVSLFGLFAFEYYLSVCQIIK